MEVEKIINIRPHHFLCLPGYKGNAYSKEHANNWDKLSFEFAQNPNLKVRITKGEDSLCLKCPNSKAERGFCKNKFVEMLDNKVKEILGLKDGEVYSYKFLLDKLKSILNPKKHEELCGECAWRKQGLCNDTFKKG